MKINRLYGLNNLIRSLMICFVIASADAAIAQEVKVVGCFDNVQSSGEHAYGYFTELWQSGGKILGFVFRQHGLVGDPPMGLLSNVQYDSQTGKISFEAKISAGVSPNKEGKFIPTRDLISFDGLLKSDELQGNITLKGYVDSRALVFDKREDFVMRKNSSCSLENHDNYDRWWGYWEPIYKLRGPKW